MQEDIWVHEPARLVYLWQRCSQDRMFQVVFEWESGWPEKYVIECYEGLKKVARSDRLSWETVREFLDNEYRLAEGSLPIWYHLVHARLVKEKGGAA